jgi:hypothetical protein
MLIPFFPKKEFAINCAVYEWSNFKAEPIELAKFINEFLIPMKEDRVKPSIFPTDNHTAVVSTYFKKNSKNVDKPTNIPFVLSITLHTL